MMTPARASAAESGLARFDHEDEPCDSRRFQTDRNRILFSSSLARLAEISQTVTPDHGYSFHNRLTHSLKVAETARLIAERLIDQSDPALVEALGGIEPAAAEAAGLAHDLGHPPFGHTGEAELQRLAGNKHEKDFEGLKDSFEGNAQSFRLVTKLAVAGRRNLDNAKLTLGLNLTRRTLNGILKYPYLHNNDVPAARTKWGAYESETEIFAWVRQGHDERRTLEAEIMDWADDLTYAVHDLFDFFFSGQIPLHLFYSRQGQPQAAPELLTFVNDEFRRNASNGHSTGTDPDRLEDGLKAFLTAIRADLPYEAIDEERIRYAVSMEVLLRHYIGAIELNPAALVDKSVARVTIDHSARNQVNALKSLTRHYVIFGHDTLSEREGQRRAVEVVFDVLWDAARKEPRKRTKGFGGEYLFPRAYRGKLMNHEIGGAERARIIVDYVAGMSEPELKAKYASFQMLR